MRTSAPRGRADTESLERCHDRALRLLTVRWRSKREMQDRLRGAGFAEETVSAELSRLERAGLLDDTRFAREFARYSVEIRKVGRRSIERGLALMGVPRETIEETTRELSAEEEERRARRLASARARRLLALDRATAFGRLAGFLARRGFDPSLARRAAAEALSVELDDPDVEGVVPCPWGGSERSLSIERGHQRLTAKRESPISHDDRSQPQGA